MSLVLRNFAFTIVVPGAGGVLLPWLVLSASEPRPQPTAWPALAPIAAGFGLYLGCMWLFATIGRGTPGPWDAPRRLVMVGPYRWVRNPIYVGVLLVVLGEAWLFLSSALLGYAVIAAVGLHLFVTRYEEPTLRRSFGQPYVAYLAAVPRWLPRPPREG